MVEIIGLQVNTLTRIYEGIAPPSTPLSGDIFREYNSSNFLIEEWFRNDANSNWYSTKEYQSHLNFTSVTNSTFLRLSSDLLFDGTFNLFLTKNCISANVSNLNDASRYWRLQLQRINKAQGTTLLGSSLSTQSLVINNYHYFTDPLNLAINPLSVNLAAFGLSCTRVSTSSALTVSNTLYYRKIRL